MEIHPLLRAGIAHHWLMYINPFVLASQRAAWLLTEHILHKAGYNARGWLNILDYFANDSSSYYQKLFSGVADNDITTWLEYFLQGIHHQYKSIMESVRKDLVESKREISAAEKITEPLPALETDEPQPADSSVHKIILNERQRLILEMAERYTTFHRRDIIAELKIAGRYSPKTISRDLRGLTQGGYLQKGGSKKGIYYTLKKR